jgi:hypothetical protein
MIEGALRAIEEFRGSSLAATIAGIEARLASATTADTIALNAGLALDRFLIASAAEVKRASAQIDVIIHTLGILYSLPHLLEEGELVETVSLGAGNAGSDFDLVTNCRIAEFKFIYWQGGQRVSAQEDILPGLFQADSGPVKPGEVFLPLEHRDSLALSWRQEQGSPNVGPQSEPGRRFPETVRRCISNCG